MQKRKKKECKLSKLEVNKAKELLEWMARTYEKLRK